ncbi:LPS assembly lipoprotein LptE [Nitrosomonas sp.]|uniref:LPS-assembly lipoprotein LptE n=1 Tax=Nitrosomonas sp. TaxID=42353 RepID=UPI0025EE17D0|nr:LPS assembly lipoprotein LptE [Nitrosomonas sp.]
MINIHKQQSLLLIILIIVVLLTACGFKLRGQAATLPFKTMYVTAPDGHTIGIEMERMIKATPTTRLVDSTAEAEATLDIISAVNERAILSLSGGGRVRDFNLIYRVNYRVLDNKGIEIMPNTEISLTRVLPFLDAQILAKESEERLLAKDMQSDAIQQILWRLSTIKFPAESTQ